MKIFILLLTLIAISVAEDPKSVSDSKLVKEIDECLKTTKDDGTVECVANSLGSDIVAAKEKIENLSQTSSQNIKDYLKAKGDDIKAAVIQSAQQFLVNAIPATAKITAVAAPFMINSLCTAVDYLEEKKNELVDSEMVFRLNKCIKQDVNKTQCVADVLGDNIYIAKAKAEALMQEAPQKIKDFLKVKGEQINHIIENKDKYYEQYKELAKQWYNYLTDKNIPISDRPKRATKTAEIDMAKNLLWMLATYTAPMYTLAPIAIRSFCSAYQYFGLAQQKVSSLKDMAGSWYSYYMGSSNSADAAKPGQEGSSDNSWLSYLWGRRKRDIPTQAEIGLAQSVAACMKATGETKPDYCVNKILGSNQQKIDPVKLQAIINYEALLEELKEYFKAKEEGKTLHEFLESKKKANA